MAHGVVPLIEARTGIRAASRDGTVYSLPAWTRLGTIELDGGGSGRLYAVDGADGKVEEKGLDGHGGVSTRMWTGASSLEPGFK